jgi:hypothetical protein
MGETTYQGDPPFQLLLAQQPTARGDNGVVDLTLFASVPGKGPADVPVRLGLSTSDATRLIADIQRAIEEARHRNR